MFQAKAADSSRPATAPPWASGRKLSLSLPGSQSSPSHRNEKILGLCGNLGSALSPVVRLPLTQAEDVFRTDAHGLELRSPAQNQVASVSLHLLWASVSLGTLERWLGEAVGKGVDSGAGELGSES